MLICKYIFNSDPPDRKHLWMCPILFSGSHRRFSNTTGKEELRDQVFNVHKLHLQSYTLEF